MARRWRNYTDLPDETLKPIYEAVCPPGLSAHDVEIKNRSRGVARGAAYYTGSSYHKTGRPFVVVSLTRFEKHARFSWKARKGYLDITVGSRLEVFVVLLAHELRHLWQAKSKGKPRGMVYGAKGRFSERDADAYALRMLRRYRRGELVVGSSTEVGS